MLNPGIVQLIENIQMLHNKEFTEEEAAELYDRLGEIVFLDNMKSEKEQELASYMEEMGVQRDG